MSIDVFLRQCPGCGRAVACLPDSLFLGCTDHSGTEQPRDNADPHPVILTVHPREWRVPFAHQWEAEYEIDVEHPATCSGAVEECPVADYLDVIGVDQDLYAGFPEPDDLSDDDLAALNGTVRFLVMTRTYSGWSSPNGVEHDVDYDFTWKDTDQ